MSPFASCSPGRLKPVLLQAQSCTHQRNTAPLFILVLNVLRQNYMSVFGGCPQAGTDQSLEAGSRHTGAYCSCLAIFELLHLRHRLILSGKPLVAGSVIHFERLLCAYQDRLSMCEVVCECHGRCGLQSESLKTDQDSRQRAVTTQACLLFKADVTEYAQARCGRAAALTGVSAGAVWCVCQLSAPAKHAVVSALLRWPETTTKAKPSFPVTLGIADMPGW